MTVGDENSVESGSELESIDSKEPNMTPDLEAVFLENAFYVTSTLRVAASQAMKKEFRDATIDDRTTKRLLYLSIHQQRGTDHPTGHRKCGIHYPGCDLIPDRYTHGREL